MMEQRPPTLNQRIGYVIEVAHEINAAGANGYRGGDGTACVICDAPPAPCGHEPTCPYFLVDAVLDVEKHMEAQR